MCVFVKAMQRYNILLRRLCDVIRSCTFMHNHLIILGILMADVRKKTYICRKKLGIAIR